MSMAWRWLRLLLLVGLASLWLAACGGDDAPGAAATTTSADEAADEVTKADDAGGDDDDDEQAPSRVETVGGLAAVRLSATAQAQTGVRTLALEGGTHAASFRVPAEAVDVRALLDLRARYNAVRGERDVARAASAASAREAERLRELHADDGNISLRQLQEAEARAAADAARLATAARSAEDVRREAVLQWGERLAEAVLGDDGPLLDRLVARRDALVLVSLPRSASGAPATIRLGGEGGQPREARLVSAALQTDPISQGETWYYRTDAKGLRVGMRLDAWIPRTGGARQGVEVPSSAVIWYADRPWVYVQADEERFVRTPLPAHDETDGGWFVAEGLAAGDRVVVSGAQMLFSEEFRARIPSEDEGP